MSKITFMRYAVKKNGKKARIRYSLDNRIDRRPAVKLYAQSYDDGEVLGEIFPEAYQNLTDSHSDYFDKGSVNLFEGHPLYRQARETALEAEWADRTARRKRTQHARSR